MYTIDDIKLSAVADFNSKILNNSFTKLLINDNSIVPEVNYIPTIWEHQWFNNDATPGYSKGQCVWKHTISSLEDFLDNYGNLVYDYAQENDKLKTYLLSSWSDIKTYAASEVAMMTWKCRYYNVISGYATGSISSNPTTGEEVITADYTRVYDQLFEFGNARPNVVDKDSRIEVYVSTIDDNKELLSNRNAWKSVVLSDQAAYDSYISTEVSILFDQHISAYHFNNELTPENISDTLLQVDLKNFDITKVQTAKVTSHDKYVDSEGFDCVKLFAKRQDTFTYLSNDFKTYRWFRLWNSGRLEHGGTIAVPPYPYSDYHLNLADGYVVSVNLDWEAEKGDGTKIRSEKYNYQETSASFYGNVTGNLYYAKTSPEVRELYGTSDLKLGPNSRYLVIVTPISFDLAADLSASKELALSNEFKVVSQEQLLNNGSGYSTPNDDVMSSFINVEVHHMKNDSFCFTRARTKDISKANSIQFYSYYTSGIKVLSYSINQAKVYGIEDEYEYTGSEIKPEPVVEVGGDILVEGIHYALTYKNNKEAGSIAVITIEGIGQYDGKKDVTFRISKSLKSCEFIGLEEYYEFEA